MTTKGIRLGLALSMLLMTIGCSSFNEKWEQAASRPIPADDVVGPWAGKWQSRKGHGSGNLLCVIEPATQTGDATAPYIAHFRATFWGIFKSSYSIPLTRQDGTPNAFAGQKDLGWLVGGLYTYSADITPTAFKATYQSKGDSGAFELARPK
jgi:hypothetical protein